MSIGTYKAEWKDIPGIKGLTMRYEDGGAVQVYSIGETSVRVGPDAPAHEIKAALLEALK